MSVAGLIVRAKRENTLHLCFTMFTGFLSDLGGWISFKILLMTYKALNCLTPRSGLLLSLSSAQVFLNSAFVDLNVFIERFITLSCSSLEAISVVNLFLTPLPPLKQAAVILINKTMKTVKLNSSQAIPAKQMPGFQLIVRIVPIAPIVSSCI